MPKASISYDLGLTPTHRSNDHTLDMAVLHHHLHTDQEKIQVGDS